MPSVYDRGLPLVDGTSSATLQVIAVGTSSGQSAAFDSETKIVRMAANNGCFVKFGSNPTAAVTDGVFVSNRNEVWAKVNPGDKVAVISHDSIVTGKLTVTEMKSNF